MKRHITFRPVAEGALFHLAFTAAAFAALEAWARVCEARRTHNVRP